METKKARKLTKKQIAARKYIREHEFEIKVHAICQLLGYTSKAMRAR